MRVSLVIYIIVTDTQCMRDEPGSGSIQQENVPYVVLATRSKRGGRLIGLTSSLPLLAIARTELTRQKHRNMNQSFLLYNTDVACRYTILYRQIHGIKTKDSVTMEKVSGHCKEALFGCWWGIQCGTGGSQEYTYISPLRSINVCGLFHSQHYSVSTGVPFCSSPLVLSRGYNMLHQDLHHVLRPRANS